VLNAEAAMTPTYLSEKFSQALPYDRYVLTGTDEQQRRWKQVYDLARLTDPQKQLVDGFVRETKLLVVSGIWCGDCVQQCPLMQRIAEGNLAKIDLRLVDRDEHRDLIEQLRINAGDRVPVAVFMAEDFERCGVFGDRTLSRYRALARKQLGASCPIAIAAPDQDEMAATLADWLDEFERVALMLRLSSRLRQKHGD
jgi:thiol-disulfide isomerase/thioredoxin